MFAAMKQYLHFDIKPQVQPFHAIALLAMPAKLQTNSLPFIQNPAVT